MIVAAFQTPLLPAGSMDSIALIRKRIDWCETAGVEILCCPEAILGGLADYSDYPEQFSIRVSDGELNNVLSPLESDNVCIIVGFTEIDNDGRLFNSAAVYHRGAVVGVYRKLHPAINSSVYSAGDRYPVFEIGDLKFGVVICRDSNFSEPARIMADSGATALFVPTNNGLPKHRDFGNLRELTTQTDVSLAVDNQMFVIRADVAGETDRLVSCGSSEIVSPDGIVLQSAMRFGEDLVVANICTCPKQTQENAG